MTKICQIKRPVKKGVSINMEVSCGILKRLERVLLLTSLMKDLAWGHKTTAQIILEIRKSVSNIKFNI